MRKKHRRMLIAAVLVAILVAIALYSYVLWGNKDKVKQIVVLRPEESADHSSIKVWAEIIPDGEGEFSGSAAVRIHYLSDPGSSSAETVYSRDASIKDNRVQYDLRYSEFVMGNGEYEVEVEFRGKSASESFSVDFVPETFDAQLQFPDRYDPDTKSMVSANARDVRDGEAEIGVSLVLRKETGSTNTQEPRNQTLRLTLTGPDGAQSTEEVRRSGLVGEFGYFFSVPYLSWGNNTFNFEITNYAVHPSSSYRTLEKDYYHFVDAVPVIVCENDDVRQSLTASGNRVDVEIDAGDSFDDHRLSMFWVSVVDDAADANDEPYVEYIESIFQEYDGTDNDGDGTVDEPGEASDGELDFATTVTFRKRGSYTVSVYVGDDNNDEGVDVESGEQYIAQSSEPCQFRVEITL